MKKVTMGRASALILIASAFFSCASVSQPEQAMEEVVGIRHPGKAQAIATALEIWEDHKQEEALSLLYSALESDPLDPWLHYELARREEGRGETGQALALGQTAVELDPNFAKGHIFVARLTFNYLDDKAKAVDHLVQAWEADDSIETGLELLSWIQWEKDYIELAAGVYDSLIGAYEENPQLFESYAYWLTIQERRDEAVEAMERATVLAADLDDDPWAMASIAQSASKFGLHDPAVSLADVAGSKIDGDPWLAYTLAQVYLNAGYLEEAEPYWEISAPIANDVDDWLFFSAMTSALIERSAGSESMEALEYYGLNGENPIYLAIADGLVARFRGGNELQGVERVRLVIEEQWGSVESFGAEHPWFELLDF